MDKETNNIDYGIYIDHQRAFIVSLDGHKHESLINEQETDNREPDYSIEGGHNFHAEKHTQNAKHEQLKKFCKSIVNKLTDANRLLIFGPSVTKFELQKEIRESSRLKHIAEVLLVTDNMDEEEAINFTHDFYTKENVKAPS